MKLGSSVEGLGATARCRRGPNGRAAQRANAEGYGHVARLRGSGEVSDVSTTLPVIRGPRRVARLGTHNGTAVHIAAGHALRCGRCQPNPQTQPMPPVVVKALGYVAKAGSDSVGRDFSLAVR